MDLNLPKLPVYKCEFVGRRHYYYSTVVETKLDKVMYFFKRKKDGFDTIQISVAEFESRRQRMLNE